MQLGNREFLDNARNALRDQFDAIWIASDTVGAKESRAIKAAMKLDCIAHNRGGFIIGPGYRLTVPAVLYAHGGDYVPPAKERSANPLWNSIDSICNPPSLGGIAKP